MSNLLVLSNDVMLQKKSLQICIDTGSVKLDSDLNANSSVQIGALPYKSDSFIIGLAQGNYVDCPPCFVKVEKDSAEIMLQNNNPTTKINKSTWITYLIVYYKK